ncbi:hypothetical protein HYALB_00007185 [Hymenoscyphus albidus]|uniref:Transmembrane protein n=1 Tax=Hymenoscyphus albidus TaxID=595503 RepID=A0A9N9LTY8_9HELO|nr:hypothetical protein HYALB_00007185 [Hymenoscyphus albidus]
MRENDRKFLGYKMQALTLFAHGAQKKKKKKKKKGKSFVQIDQLKKNWASAVFGVGCAFFVSLVNLTPLPFFLFESLRWRPSGAPTALILAVDWEFMGSRRVLGSTM